MTDLRKITGPVGYAWLRDHLNVPSFLGAREARMAGVNALERLPEGGLLVPARMAPPATILDHVLFALKHEQINLHLLALALKRVPSSDMEASFAATPNGVYIRTACCLWEMVTGKSLATNGATITAPYQEVFDPVQFFVGESRKSAKWRVDFNGLGDISFCPIVRKTPGIQQLLAEDVLKQARAFAENTNTEMLDRALGWAYMSETEGSFAIEGEVPTQDKARAFTQLLQHASDPKALTEELLCELQRMSITNPFDKAWEFRSEQNRLQKGVGAAGVRYVPPRPEMVVPLMTPLMALANRPPKGLDPLVHAAIISFGFVYIHPFMDGNGRLSRFLVHHCLGQSNALPTAFVLPVSVALRRHEDAYLEALHAFSKPARELCHVTWGGDANYAFDWLPEADEAFRFMDLTACVEFTMRMAQVALQKDLLGEAQWLGDFDLVYAQIKARFDIRDNDLSHLVAAAFHNGGVVSKNIRKKYIHRVPVETLDAIEARCLNRMAARASPPDDAQGLAAA
ncbi:hypothetical protein J2W49_001774 [Hydrogenophaga palleronii]|uniref:Fido domain-containing protein n=1 Tax=Hydrogenophaga palleronii TaxID=65655 RepID=A0ABU1WKT8_9BURK|nr:Fic family protein [Hydrogenophaga palleronii]MDR7149819.1 hypothetical protein [Hydrogenophaga palleronii]